MLKPQSPTPDRPAGGVAGPDDVDIRTISDVTNWLRVLRLHVSREVRQSTNDRNTRPILPKHLGKI
jgi:hypothetical protein